MREDPSILPLTLREVSYTAGGRTLLDGVSFTVEAGRKLVVIGPNGAGKSLTLRLCHGLIAPTSGSRFKPSRIGTISNCSATRSQPKKPTGKGWRISC
jgi:ATPase subunit of ABC transporter with duplicated ATPase domains